MATTREQEPQALVDDLAERIRERIMTGEIPIGAQLRQAALASEFGVSRTPCARRCVSSRPVA